MSGTPFTSPEGRFVQGSLTLQQKKNDKNQPVFDTQGKPVMQCFIALAIRKDNPELQAFYAQYVQVARAAFPGMFDANGTCINPSFAWKYADGDGRSTNGKDLSQQPGFAGCYVFKFSTQFPPTCYARDSNNNLVQLVDPEKLIKKGYKIRVSGTIDGNGVAPGGAAKPGLYASPNMILFVAPDEEIVSVNADPNAAFGNLPSQAGLAVAGAGVPIGGVAPTLGGVATPGIGGLPGLNGAAPVLGAAGALGGMAAPGLGAPGLGAPPAQLGAPAGLGAPGLGAPPAQQMPQFTMQPSAQGATRESLHGLGWTDAALIAGGHMVQNW